MELSMTRAGEEAMIKSVGGHEEQRLFLENLGFVPGARVKAVSSVNGNMIVKIRESRVALSREMAERIIV